MSTATRKKNNRKKTTAAATVTAPQETEQKGEVMAQNSAAEAIKENNPEVFSSVNNNTPETSEPAPEVAAEKVAKVEEVTESKEETKEPEGLGIIFFKARQEAGRTIEEVTAKTCIKKDYIEFIEQSAFDKLPGGTYNIGFLRTYGDYLGLDTDYIVQQYKERHANLQAANNNWRENKAAEQSSAALPSKAALIASIVVAMAIFVGWYVFQQTSNDALEVRPVSEVLPEISTQAPITTTETRELPNLPLNMEEFANPAENAVSESDENVTTTE